MLSTLRMNPLTFTLLGLLNGSLVGLFAVLCMRAVFPGVDWLRIRDGAAMGMVGSLAGNIIATGLYLEDGYIEGPPSSLMFAFAGAALVLASLACLHLFSRTPRRERAYGSSRA
jgi:hypothetical protein